MVNDRKSKQVQAMSPVATRKSVQSTASQSEYGVLAGTAIEAKLIAVDDVREAFMVAILIHTHFRHRSVPANPDADDEFVRTVEFDEALANVIPKVILVNVVEGGEFELVTRVNFRTGDVWVAYKTLAWINESLELQKFPFDRQLFRVSFKSPNAQFTTWNLSKDILDFDLDSSGNQNDTFLVACELNTWRMANIVVGIHTDDPDPVSLAKGEVDLTIQAERDPMFFLYNFVLIIYIIVVLNASVLAVDVKESMGDRIAISGGLLLAAVAFKFVLADQLPRVGYSTLMDYYVIIAFLFLGVGSVEHMFVSPHIRCATFFFKDMDLDEMNQARESCIDEETIATSRLDGYFQVSFALLWTAFNLFVCILSFCPGMVRESWEKVANSQVGETCDSQKRSNVVYDLDSSEKGAILKA